MNMSDKTEQEFREWLFGSLVGGESEVLTPEKRKEFAALVRPYFCAPPSEPGILNVDLGGETADEIEDNASEAIEAFPVAVDERTRHKRTGSAAPRPAFKRASIPPGLRAPRQDAVLRIVGEGWDGDLGVMAKAVYGKNSPHNRRKARSMVHSLKTRGKIDHTHNRWTVTSRN